MTIYLITLEDIQELNNHTYYLRDINEHIAAFLKILHPAPSYKDEFTLRQVISTAHLDSASWSYHLNHLVQLQNELNQFSSHFLEFSDSVATYISQLSAFERQATVGQAGHAQALIQLGTTLNLGFTGSVQELISKTRAVISMYSSVFSEKNDATSKLYLSAFRVTPRIVDSFDVKIRLCTKSGHLTARTPLGLRYIQWFPDQKSQHMNTPQLQSAYDYIDLAQYNHACRTAAISNLTAYFSRLSTLLSDSATLLADMTEQFSLKEFSLNLKLATVRLEEAHALSEEVSSLCTLAFAHPTDS
ncbi:MAG: hypothetical protein JWP80_2369 [Pseudomonas sp.]|nr:hypothetical protein [Pseudomonas sp.]